MKKWIIFLVMAQVAIVSLLQAVSAQTFPMRQYTMDDGLPGNDVYGVMQDHRGYFWIGTYSGLARFDGKTFKIFDEETYGLGGTIIPDITEDAHRNLWVGYTGGVARLDGERFVNYTVEDGMLAPDVIDLWPDSKQGMWALIEGKGVNYINEGEILSYPLEGLQGYYSPMTGTPDGKIFVGSAKGIYRWTPEHPKFVLLPFDDFDFTSIHYSSVHQTLYVTGKGALYRLDGEKLTLVAESILADELLYVTTGKDGAVWLMSEQEVWKKTAQGDTIYNNTVLGEPSLSKVLEDREGNIWLGRWGGLTMIVNTQIVNYTEGLSGKIVTGIARSEDIMWISGTQGLSKREGEGTIKPIVESAYVNDLLVDGNKVYLAHEEALSVYNTEGELVQEIAKPTTTLLKDSKGKIWLGTYSGVYSMKNGQFEPEINNKQGLASDAVWALYEDRHGAIWVGTSLGASRFYEGQWNHFTTEDGLTHNSAWTFLDHPEWGLIVGSSGKLSLWTGKQFEEIPLEIRNVNSLTLDERGALWVAASPGVYRINSEKKIDLILNKNAGLTSNSTYTDSILLDENHVYIGTYKGMARIDLDATNEKSIPPLLELNQIEINQKPGDLATLSNPMEYANNNLIFHFNAIYAYQPDSITFSYLLKGFDEEWSAKSSLAQATYTNLPHGQYTFQVRAHAENGKQSEILEIPFKILPPFWLTWPFLLVAGTIAVALFALLVKFLIIRATQKSEEERIRINALYQKQLQLDKIKDDFLANTSHELRTPLNGIIGLGETILEGTNGPVTQEQAQNLELIVHSGRRLSNLVNDILDHSKLQHNELPLKMEPVDLRVATDLVFMLSKTLIGDKPVQLRNEIPKDAPLVKVDENRLQQILMNLVGNAIKFTHQGEIYFSLKQEETSMSVSITDTGIGIPQEKLDMIFQSFEQVDGSIEREYGGTGLGLSIAKQLVELHKGTLKVESEVGKGSTFTFQLPLASGEQSEASTGEQPSVPVIAPVQRFVAEETHTEAQPQPKPIENTLAPSDLTKEFPGAKILIVDDEFTNLQVLKNQLAAQDYQIFAAQSGQEALEIVEREHPDLILLDLMMPRMNGYDVCKKIRKQFGASSMPVIIVTAKNQLSDMVQGFETGANDYMTKPLQKKELLSRVQAHLQVREATNKMLENIRLQTEVEERKKSEEAIMVVNEELEASNTQLRETQTQLVQAEKNAAIGFLATGIAHELNQPLLYIRANVQMFMMDGPEKADWENVEHTMKIVEDGTDRMVETIGQLQDSSNPTTGGFAPLQLEELAEHGLKRFSDAIEQHGIGVENKNEDSLPKIIGDRYQLDQAIGHLISNAIDAVKDQDTPSIILSSMRQDDGDQICVVLIVQDNGEGISQENRNRVFDPFFTTKEVGQGIGLGLTLCLNIVKDHQGNIELENAPEGGTIAKLSFPGQ